MFKKDFGFIRMHSETNMDLDEDENVLVNPSGQHLNQAGIDPSRDPLVTIPDPSQSSKSGVEQEVGVKSKIERTPTKTKTKGSVTAHLQRTPDKQGATGRSKFGWPNPNDGKADAANNLGQGFRTMSSSNVTPRVNRTTIGRANSCSSDCTSAQNTPTKSVSKPPHPGYAPISTSRYPGSHTRTGSYAALSRGLPASSGSLAVVNTAEVPHFDLKEDPSFWMDHNVQVLIRVRPLNNMEMSIQGYNRCVRQESSQTITWVGQPETRFTFDHVACETIDQEMLFKMAGLPMVENCISGYNSCMFAYGQTGSGKTHTMLGEVGDFECRPSPQRGMTPRIFEFLFARIKAEEESRTDEKLKYSCKCSFLEIYNEQITDLLDPSSTNLLLREDVRQGGVYVENLSEFEVQTVGDILKLLAQGSANRKVAATNMNRESSRSHSVFMCVVECKWERDSTTNMRFARLNLVDLAGSERQKTSGAEGERLKEAASINKSLSTLGHVIMVLVDLANGKMRHVPYRDSRLTFLLQDSLGGNSKTMIVANISPSICCAAETLNTLKFAQRAKLIQNNAVVNEDSSGDVTALQYQIRLLKEEICALRRQNVSRSLSFGNSSVQYSTDDNEVVDMDIEQTTPYKLLDSEPKVQEVSTKQVLSLETMLAGALRREQMAEESLRKLEAEIEQLNHLVHQREEEARCSKMMLKFREDKIQRMESLLGGAKPVDAILSEENAALREEIEMLRAKIDRNPEVTRFARESIKLSEQLRRFQDFYEEGERDILLGEVSELRDKLIQFLEEKATKNNHLENLLAPHNATKFQDEDTLQLQLDNALNELEKCQGDLKLCLEYNLKLTREVDDLRTLHSAVNPTLHDFDTNDEVIKGSIVEVSPTEFGSRDGAKVQEDAYHAEHMLKHNEDFVSIELELDIMKIIMKEVQLARQRAEELQSCLSADIKLAEKSMVSIRNQYEEVKQDLKEAKSIIEAFESQQLLSVTEMEVLRQKNEEYLVLLQKQDREMMMLKEKICAQEPIVQSDFNQTPCDESSLEMKLNKMQASLDKAKRLNIWYQSDYAAQLTNQEEMEEVRRQVEAETAEVIVCLQEELSSLQHEVQECLLKEIEADNRLVVLECSLRCQQETLKVMSQENKALKEQIDEKEKNLRLLVEDWETFCSEIEDALSDGHVKLIDASKELNNICNSFSEQRRGVFEKVGKIIKRNTEQEFVIEELNLCLEDANSRISDMDGMLVSLKGAALAITQSHQQECDRKEKEIFNLRSDLSEEASKAIELARKIEKGRDEIRRASTCATVAFLIVARLSDVNAGHLDALRLMDIKLKESKELNLVKEALLHDQAVAFEEAGKQIQALRVELEEKQGRISVMQKRIEENVVIEEESKELNLMKEALLNDQAVAMEEAEMQIQAFSNELAQKERCISLMQKRIEENDVEILKTREQLSELILGVSSVRSCMDEYTEKGYKHKHVCGDEMSHAGGDDANYLEESEGSVELLRDVPSKAGINNPSMERVDQDNIRSANAYKDYTGKDATIILLRKEIESAMNSLQGVRAEMACLISEKKEASVYEKQSREGVEIIKAHVCNLQASFVAFEDQCLLKLQALDKKLFKVEESAQETSCCWSHAKESYQCELSEANESAAQKAAETSCIFANFAQAQDAMRDADVVINGLMIANETIKLEVEGLKNANLKLSCERDLLAEKLENLLSDGAAKQEQCDAHIQDLEHTITEMKRSSKEVLMSLVEEICLIKSQSQQVSESVAENYMIELSAKELELLFMASELRRVADQMADIKNKELSNCTVLEHLERETIILGMSTHLTGHLLLEKETEVDCLREEADKVEMHLDQCFVDIIEMQVVNTVSKQDLLVLNDVSWELKCELDEAFIEKTKLLNQIQSHEEERGNLIRNLEKMEKELEVSSSHSLDLDQQNKGLQDDIFTMQSSLQELHTQLKTKDIRQSQMNLLEEANQALQKELDESRREKFMLTEAVEKNEILVKSSSTHVDFLHSENSELKESIQNLESTIQILQENLESEKTHLNKLQQSQSSASEELHRKSHDLQNHVMKVTALQEENCFLKEEVRSLKYGHFEALGSLRRNATEHLDLVDAADMTSQRLVHLLNEQVALLTNQISIDFSQNLEVVSKMTEDLETLDCIVSDTISENMSLQSELYRKDEILKGLQFDLSLLQEAATDSRDQKDEIENLLDSLESAEDELERRSHEVNEAIAHGQELETRLNEKIDRIYLLEKELSTSNQLLETLSKDNVDLRSCVEELSARNDSVESELMEKRKIIESLETEILDLEHSVNQMNNLTDSLKSDLHDAVCRRDQIQKEIILVEEKLDTAQALGEEHEATAAEAQEIAESRRIYAEEKEEEVKLLEKSVQELDDTINVLENKVDILRGEAERQRVQREDLELELQSAKNVLQNVRNTDADIKSHLEEKENQLKETLGKIEILQKDLANKDAEIAKCKAHISELNLHAEAQASEYKTKFKALEAMVDQVKPEGPSSQGKNTSANKVEKTAAKPRGSGSPFKCIGMGLVHQLKLEKDEELTAERIRIQDLETLVADRQKEIFVLNSRLAAAESMTHDVIRDLLGVKLDMSNYVSLLDGQQLEKITENTQFNHVESVVKDVEMKKLKQQLKEFIDEREGWLDEIDKKQSQLIAAQLELEKLRQRDRSVTAENDMLKAQNTAHKKRVTQLEEEVNELSGQQNLQLRVHHHAKTKEENKVLKMENEELNGKLQRAESFLSRVREELARYRSRCGRIPYINIDDEKRLNEKLKDSEQERVQLAQRLLSQCTSILKVAGIDKPSSEIDISSAEGALDQLRTRIISLERELENSRLKCRLDNERTRLSELLPQRSPASSRADSNCPPLRRSSRTPLFSADDR